MYFCCVQGWGELSFLLLCHFDLTDPPWPTPLAILKGLWCLMLLRIHGVQVKNYIPIKFTISRNAVPVCLPTASCPHLYFLPTDLYLYSRNQDDSHLPSGQAFMVKICSWYNYDLCWFCSSEAQLRIITKYKTTGKKWNPKRTTLRKNTHKKQ